MNIKKNINKILLIFVFIIIFIIIMNYFFKKEHYANINANDTLIKDCQNIYNSYYQNNDCNVSPWASDPDFLCDKCGKSNDPLLIQYSKEFNKYFYGCKYNKDGFNWNQNDTQSNYYTLDANEISGISLSCQSSPICPLQNNYIYNINGTNYFIKDNKKCTISSSVMSSGNPIIITNSNITSQSDKCSLGDQITTTNCKFYIAADNKANIYINDKLIKTTNGDLWTMDVFDLFVVPGDKFRIEVIGLPGSNNTFTDIAVLFGYILNNQIYTIQKTKDEITSGCVGFVNDSTNKKCWLKQSLSNNGTASTSGYTTYSKNSDGTYFTRTSGLDYGGNTILEYNYNNLSDCNTLCNNFSNMNIKSIQNMTITNKYGNTYNTTYTTSYNGGGSTEKNRLKSYLDKYTFLKYWIKGTYGDQTFNVNFTA